MKHWVYLSILCLLLWGGVKLKSHASDGFWNALLTEPRQTLSATARAVWRNARDLPDPRITDAKCLEMLTARGLNYSVDRKPLRSVHIAKGCHRQNTVTLKRIGDVSFDSTLTLSCRAALSLTDWVQTDLKKLSALHLKERIKRVSTMGTYSCRNIAGSRRLSQHSFANAIDIGGFTTQSGKRISVLNHWEANNAKASFLRAAAQSACTRFRLVLSPDYNAAHKDHFHFDMGLYKRCRVNPPPVT